ncbi:hypothetical protein VTJ83DRAFT_336 [Remersonia thermophila]|uniref:Uncharacterized protein n=1 Tax=Remersonia thermophila TaxID=72144 RepID=A0ABR4DKP6_9PEZI
MSRPHDGGMSSDPEVVPAHPSASEHPASPPVMESAKSEPYSSLEPAPLSELEPTSHPQWSYPLQASPSGLPKDIYGSPGPWSATSDLPPGAVPTATTGPAYPHGDPQPGLEVVRGPEERRVLGLTVRRFWIAVFLLVLILAAGIAGGVAGGMAAQGKSGPSVSAAASDAAAGDDPPSESQPATVQTSGSTLSPSPTIDTNSAAADPSPSPSRTASSVRGGASPAPTDDGCPDIDESTYQPRDAFGKAAPLKALGGRAQRFVVRCDTNWPSGAKFGNPGIQDIMKLYLPSLEACMDACAVYNQKYEANLAEGFGETAAGLCRAVTVVKRSGEYCYLKNGTGTINTYGRPDEFASAELVVF